MRARTSIIRSALTAMAVGSLLSGCASWQEEVENFGYAAAAPARDLNLYNPEAPPILLALREPYGAPLYPGCPGLLREASALTYAIEANNRAAPGYRRDSRNFIGRFGNLRDATVRTAANRLLPWRYIVRQVSGSAKRKQDASRANDRARLRIGYLIGLSRGQGCPGF